jgi:hypothetical protein
VSVQVDDEGDVTEVSAGKDAAEPPRRRIDVEQDAEEAWQDGQEALAAYATRRIE